MKDMLLVGEIVLPREQYIHWFCKTKWLVLRQYLYFYTRSYTFDTTSFLLTKETSTRNKLASNFFHSFLHTIMILCCLPGFYFISLDGLQKVFFTTFLKICYFCIPIKHNPPNTHTNPCIIENTIYLQYHFFLIFFIASHLGKSFNIVSLNFLYYKISSLDSVI